MAKAMTAPTPASPHEVERRMHVTLPTGDAKRLKGMAVGDKVTVTLTGKVCELHAGEYDAGFAMELSAFELPGAAKPTTLNEAVEAGKRRMS